MIFDRLQRHLPSWLATLVCGGVYATLIVAVWLRWDAPQAVFRYVGL